MGRATVSSSYLVLLLDLLLIRIRNCPLDAKPIFSVAVLERNLFRIAGLLRGTNMPRKFLRVHKCGELQHGPALARPLSGQDWKTSRFETRLEIWEKRTGQHSFKWIIRWLVKDRRKKTNFIEREKWIFLGCFFISVESVKRKEHYRICRVIFKACELHMGQAQVRIFEIYFLHVLEFPVWRCKIFQFLMYRTETAGEVRDSGPMLPRI